MNHQSVPMAPSHSTARVYWKISVRCLAMISLVRCRTARSPMIRHCVALKSPPASYHPNANRYRWCRQMLWTNHFSNVMIASRVTTRTRCNSASKTLCLKSITDVTIRKLVNQLELVVWRDSLKATTSHGQVSRYVTFSKSNYDAYNI